MRRSLFKTALAMATLAGLAGLSACKAKHENLTTTAREDRAAVVRVEKIGLQEIPLTEEIIGNIRAKTRATLEARQSGIIEKLPVAVGDKVEAGDLIARLDSAESRARVDQARASLEQAERESKRILKLFEQQSATRAERDAAEARFRVASATAAEAKASLEHTEILAPFKGVLTRRWAEVGDLAMPGKPLVDIEDQSVFQVEIDLPESLPLSIASGAVFDIEVPTGTEKAALREVAPTVDPLTRTRTLKLELTNPKHPSSGQFVRVLVPLGVRNALIVPKEALIERGQLQIVFSVGANRARLRLVKVGMATGRGFEILSGLEPGETVVIEGAERLKDGQPVEVK